MEDEKRNETILVVDDDRSVREVICASLKKEGYSVVPAENGKEAMDMITRRAFDMVFLDIRMPGFNGKDILTLMGISHPEMPVAMLTAVISPEVEQEVLKLGAVAYLKKPCSLHEIAQTAEDVLARKSRGEFAVHAEGKEPETLDAPPEGKQYTETNIDFGEEVLGI